jgi:hypothetical protein
MSRHVSVWLPQDAQGERRASLFQLENRPENLKPGQGLNPLVGATVICTDEASACEARAKESGLTCSAVLPRWRCYGLPSSPKDPLDGLTFCYPSLAMCEAVRTPHIPLLSDGNPIGTPCKPVETVYCQGNDPSQCADDEQLCNLASEMVAETLRGAPPARKCEARHSAR